mgnify:CR=1 FL=1
MQLGIVGKPNVGKSTIFNALTRSAVITSPRLFATLDPTVRALDLEDAHVLDPRRAQGAQRLQAVHAAEPPVEEDEVRGALADVGRIVRGEAGTQVTTAATGVTFW